MAKKIDPAVASELMALKKQIQGWIKVVDAARVKDTDSIQKQIQDLEKTLGTRISALEKK